MKPIQTTTPTEQPFSPAPVAMNRRVALIVRDVTITTNQPRELKEVVIRPGREEGLTSNSCSSGN